MRGREKTGRGHAAREHAGPQNAGQTAPSPRAEAVCPPGLLRYELRRGFGSLGFRLGLLGALAVVLGHLVTSLLPLTRYQDAWQKDAFLAPHSAWLHWIGLDNATRWPTLLAMLLPLLAALPAAASAAWDRETGYLNQLRLRCTARQYRLARLAAVFCTAFAVTVLPLLADLALSTALLPAIRPDPASGACPIADSSLLGGWFYRCPLGYILGYTLFDGPLALLVSLLQQAGGRRAILRFGSRAAYWQAGCRAAAARAALFAGALVLGASLAGLGMDGVNWGRPGSLFAQTTGGPLAQPPGLGAVCAALWAAAALQLLALQLLWGLLSCRLRPLAALVGVLAADLALCSPVRPDLWLRVCCGAACWARPGGPALRLAGWLACCGGLYLLGRLAWRRADVL